MLLLVGCMSPPHPVRCECACGDVYVDVPSADIHATRATKGTILTPRR